MSAFLRLRTPPNYANSSFLLVSFCPPPCQAVGADAVATARSREALVDAVKCSGGINTTKVGMSTGEWLQVGTGKVSQCIRVCRKIDGSLWDR